LIITFDISKTGEIVRKLGCSSRELRLVLSGQAFQYILRISGKRWKERDNGFRTSGETLRKIL
jgi:hypothetical protein